MGISDLIGVDTPHCNFGLICGLQVINLKGFYLALANNKKLYKVIAPSTNCELVDAFLEHFNRFFGFKYEFP